ncbi:MAG TPA: hypothetical protein PLE74_04785 [Candidatus Cloacimonadota bacterium]|nr:hypothetical protein [Candidatus Cloacimonadota bacterium]
MTPYEVRVGIDNQTTNLLFFANGGGTIALLAVLPQVIVDPKYDALSVSILIGLGVLCVGVLTTVLCNGCRRQCSWNYEHNVADPSETPACKWETRLRWASSFTFPLAAIIVLIGNIIFMYCR